jgi:hypothetical protein
MSTEVSLSFKDGSSKTSMTLSSSEILPVVFAMFCAQKHLQSNPNDEQPDLGYTVRHLEIIIDRLIGCRAREAALDRLLIKEWLMAEPCGDPPATVGEIKRSYERVLEDGLCLSEELPSSLIVVKGGGIYRTSYNLDMRLTPASVAEVLQAIECEAKERYSNPGKDRDRYIARRWARLLKAGGYSSDSATETK